MSATEELRKVLDERGVEWWETVNDANCVFTWWESPTFGTVHAMDNDDGETLFMACLNNRDFTPEQAIAATLGKQGYYTDRDDEGTHIMCDRCGEYIGTAEEIAATLGGGECEFVIEDNMNETEGMGDVWIECSACHCVFDFYADEWLMKMSYCPHCGCRIRE